ncbi:MAG: UDP-N-acetylmuramate dehydrogenase [Alistipes sp.]|nr:UDP-N-acetylmuramate dehydrogenase [Alistipes sp.]
MIREFNEINLASRNSFHVEQSARRLIEFDSEEDLQSIFGREPIGRWMVLSGGNNILFTEDYDGVLLTPVSQRIEPVEENDERVVVRVGAGVEWDDLVAWAVERGLWGLENLSLIPGKAGAAPVQNIGAYGAEAKDVIRSVRFYDTKEGAMRTLGREECAFGYRESIFKQELKGRVVITEIEIELSKRANPRLGYGDVEREVERLGGATLANIREAICSIRRSKLPDTAVLGNAGSFFKNPVVERAVAERLLADYPEMPHYAAADPAKVKLAAGWLIDRAGLKGYREGAVGVHERQALVLVNHGGATGGEVIALARKVQAVVKQTFGVEIDTEVNIL